MLKILLKTIHLLLVPVLLVEFRFCCYFQYHCIPTYYCSHKKYVSVNTWCNSDGCNRVAELFWHIYKIDNSIEVDSPMIKKIAAIEQQEGTKPVASHMHSLTFISSLIFEHLCPVPRLTLQPSSAFVPFPKLVCLLWQLLLQWA